MDSLALYKVGNGEDIASAPSPGMFDLKASPLTPHPRPGTRATRAFVLSVNDGMKGANTGW